MLVDRRRSESFAILTFPKEKRSTFKKYNRQQELEKDMQKDEDHLQQLKDNDERLAKETKEREQERKRNEVMTS